MALLTWQARARRRVAVRPSYDELLAEERGSHPASGPLQLVMGDDRAEVSFHDLERLENRPLFQELTIILRALPVVAATDILGRKMSAARPTPAAWCRRIRVDRSCQLVMAAVADVSEGRRDGGLAARRVETTRPRASEPSSGPQRVADRPHERFLI
jgi:hypothetical protein